MCSFCAEETKRLEFIAHLEEIRRRILFVICIVICFTIISFWQIDRIMMFVTTPIKKYVPELIFISPTEAFSSYIKLALLSGVVFTFPFMLYQLGAFVLPAFKIKARRRLLLWLFSGAVLFYAGLMFSYFIAIPAALDFLLTFKSEFVTARITLGKYVSFFSALIFVGGFIFEIPVIAAFLTDAGIVNAHMLKAKRKYAVLLIAVLAAVITPTQDIFNMLLFAVPMVVLYEISIFISGIIEKSKLSKNVFNTNMSDNTINS
ncbi:MAG: twin-arginine translocase subunit TatC [Candidatus Omnitrophota bacterium]